MYRIIYAHIRYYYRIPHPEDLPEDYVMMLWADLLYIREEERKHTLGN